MSGQVSRGSAGEYQADDWAGIAFIFIYRLSLSANKGGVICISEVIDISAGNLDSSLCFFQPSVSHDVLCI